MSGSGFHDRRGFDWLLKLFLLLIPVSLLLFFYSWPIAIVSFLLSGISFITIEAISARPDNNPITFLKWVAKQDKRKPVLLCLGDSLTHVNASASITPEIPWRLCQTLGFPLPKYGKTFSDPIWVVNAGQNNLTSYAVWKERVQSSMSVFPDYVCLMIGTNDVQDMYWGSRHMQSINKHAVGTSMDALERNIAGILATIQEASPMTAVAVCTLPPLGEDLTSPANKLIRQANACIERAVASGGDRVTLLPVYDELEYVLEKQRSKWSWPYRLWLVAAILQNPLVHMVGLSFNTVSKPFGYTVLSDGLHLNERGRDVVVDLIVDWLNLKNIAKAIAVKR